MFLENVALVADIDAMNEENGAVALMTLHSAKGLEFPVVFMIGMEENVFPTSRAKNDMSTSAMEEERRLCYVGMTRAKQQLYMINAKQRSIFGNESYNRRSRFIDEIPGEVVLSANPVKSAEQSSSAAGAKTAGSTYHNRYQVDSHVLGRVSAPAPKPAAAPVAKSFEKNQRVIHDKFGEGTVMDISGAGSSMLVSIDFGAAGVKRFAAAYAPIKPVE